MDSTTFAPAAVSGNSLIDSLGPEEYESFVNEKIV
jgi:hypothetical protein